MNPTKSHAQTFLTYELWAEMLCLGERTKGALFRPCASVFSYCTITGALKAYFPEISPLHAVARFTNGHQGNKRTVLSFSPRDRACGLSVVPLQIEYLADVHAKVFIARNETTLNLPRTFTISMGGMKSKGFGRCELQQKDVVVCENPQPGTLCVRIPQEPEVLKVFGVRRLLLPIYGYLYRASSSVSGSYQRSLFEGTRLVAYDILF